MALYLWEFGEEGLAKSLVAIEINESLAAKATKISTLPDEVASDLTDYSKSVHLSILFCRKVYIIFL